MSRSSSYLLALLLLGLWLSVIVGVVRLFDQLPDGEVLGEVLGSMRFPPFLALLLCIILANLLRTIRWRVLLGDSVRTPLLRTAAAFNWQFLLMVLSPFRVGESFRVLWVKQQGGDPLWAVGAIVVERAQDLLALLLMMAAGIHVLDLGGVGHSAGLIAVVVMAAYAGLSVLGSRLGGGGLRGTWPSRLLAAGRLLLNLRLNAASLALTGIIWCVLGLGYWVFLSAFLTQTALGLAALILSGVNLAGILPMAPGNVGPFELTVVGVLELAGFAGGNKLAVAIALHLGVMVSYGLAGVVSRLLLAIVDGRARARNRLLRATEE